MRPLIMDVVVGSAHPTGVCAGLRTSTPQRKTTTGPTKALPTVSCRAVPLKQTEVARGSPWNRVRSLAFRNDQCNRWNARHAMLTNVLCVCGQFDFPGSDPLRGDQFTLDWYFAEEEWTFRNEPRAVQVPVRCD